MPPGHTGHVGRALFDQIVVVDWSASSVPKRGRDSIWVAGVRTDADGSPSLVNPPTRHGAAAHLDELLANSNGPVLVGIDVCLGYPQGFAAAARLTGSAMPAWRAAWHHLATAIDDGIDNTNNRFVVADALNARIGWPEGPFWGTTSARHVGTHLARTRPTDVWATAPLAEHRVVEQVLRRTGKRPFSAWQLAGAGSVGSQTLTAIPVLEHLRRAGAPRVRVWPFDTGLVADPTGGDRRAVVVAEVWPSLLAVDPDTHRIRDAAQVLTLAEHLAALDRAGALGAWFAPEVAAEHATAVVDEEGWVLGVAAGALR